MPALFTFLFKVNIALVLFCLGYYLVLRHLTFYTLNRVYLVTAILFSSIYPWINLTSFVQRHQQLAAPVQSVILQWKAPAENLVKPLNQPNYWQWAEFIFWAGAALLAIRLVAQLVSLYRLYRNSEPGKVHNYAVRLIADDVSPFSFWRSIYVNPEKLSASDLEKVLEHEYVHVSEWHTLDILLAELSTIFYWFNPGIWLMKKAVRENVEFITDRKILQKGIDTKQYQYSLLSVSLSGTPNNLVNNFNISTIKKRIIMMNAKRSSRLNLSRYMFVAPAVIILLLVFSISKAGIAKKGLNTIKSITSAIKGVTISNDDRPIMRPASKQTGKAITANVKTKIKANIKSADTIYAGKSKDGKKAFIINSSISSDSVCYVIDGLKATKADLKALDPNLISSMDLLPYDKVKEYFPIIITEFFPNMTNKQQVLFVNTDDSTDAGKKIKEKLRNAYREDVAARAQDITITGSNAKAPVAANMAYSVATTTTSNDVAPVVAGSAYSISTTTSSDVAPVAVVGVGNSSAVTVVGTDTKVKPLTRVYITGSPVTKVRINGKVAPMVKLNGIELDTFVNKTKEGVYKTKEGRKNFVYLNKMRTNDETTIDGPGDKLIIVDGKEVKSLKHVSTDDIKSITMLKNETAEKRYGDKGKNGVVIITTKKGSK